MTLHGLASLRGLPADGRGRELQAATGRLLTGRCYAHNDAAIEDAALTEVAQRGITAPLPERAGPHRGRQQHHPVVPGKVVLKLDRRMIPDGRRTPPPSRPRCGSPHREHACAVPRHPPGAHEAPAAGQLVMKPTCPAPRRAECAALQQSTVRADVESLGDPSRPPARQPVHRRAPCSTPAQGIPAGHLRWRRAHARCWRAMPSGRTSTCRLPRQRASSAATQVVARTLADLPAGAPPFRCMMRLLRTRCASRCSALRVSGVQPNRCPPRARRHSRLLESSLTGAMPRPRPPLTEIACD